MPNDSKQPLDCLICGTRTKPYKNGHYPKTCSPKCLSELKSQMSSTRLRKVKEMFNPYIERPLIKKPQWQYDIEERDFVESIIK